MGVWHRCPEQSRSTKSCKFCTSISWDQSSRTFFKFLANNGLEPLVDLLKNEQEKEVRSKVMYAVSGMLKHCAPALEKFKSVGGFDVLADIVKRADGECYALRQR